MGIMMVMVISSFARRYSSIAVWVHLDPDGRLFVLEVGWAKKWLYLFEPQFLAAPKWKWWTKKSKTQVFLPPEDTQRPDLWSCPQSPRSAQHNGTWIRTGTPDGHRDPCPSARRWVPRLHPLTSPEPRRTPQNCPREMRQGTGVGGALQLQKNLFISSSWEVSFYKPDVSHLRGIWVILTHVPVPVLHEASFSEESDHPAPPW